MVNYCESARKKITPQKQAAIKETTSSIFGALVECKYLAFYKKVNCEAEGQSATQTKTLTVKKLWEQKTVIVLAQKESGVYQCRRLTTDF